MKVQLSIELRDECFEDCIQIWALDNDVNCQGSIFQYNYTITTGAACTREKIQRRKRKTYDL